MIEQVLTWWVQTTCPNDFVQGEPVISSTTRRSHRIPSNFLGSLWIFALKLVYDMDIKRFQQISPALRPVGKGSNYSTIAGIPLTDEGALMLTRDLCHIGITMQRLRMIHRDIKPKNIMLSQGHPVVIDFGFACLLSSQKKTKRFFIVKPG
jgi:serine/threonine protein kinase